MTTMSTCADRDVDKFKEKFKFKLLNDLAANYAHVERCYCAHRDRIRCVQENLKYNKRMAHLRTALIVLSALMLLLLTFLSGVGYQISEFGLASYYGRRACLRTGLWSDECEVAH